MVPVFVHILGPNADPSSRVRSTLVTMMCNHIGVDRAAEQYHLNSLDEIAKSDPDEDVRRIAAEELRSVRRVH